MEFPPYEFTIAVFENGLPHMPWFELMDEPGEIVCTCRWSPGRRIPAKRPLPATRCDDLPEWAVAGATFDRLGTGPGRPGNAVIMGCQTPVSRETPKQNRALPTRRERPKNRSEG